MRKIGAKRGKIATLAAKLMQTVQTEAVCKPADWFGLGPGARFSKDPVTLQARNQILTQSLKKSSDL